LGGVNQAWNQGLLTVVLLSVIAVVSRTQLELGKLNPRFALQLYFYSSSLLERHAARTRLNVPPAAMKKHTAIDSPPSLSLRPCHSLDRAFRNASPLGTSMGPIADPATTTSKLALEA
jgi:hypothetical protein